MTPRGKPPRRTKRRAAGGAPEWHQAVIADYQELRARPGVLSVSVGLKEVGRSLTARVCVKIYVERKMSVVAGAHHFPRTALLFVRLANGLYAERRVPTDVVEVRGLKLIAANPGKRLDPAPIGAQIGLARGEGIDGTLGCWVRKAGVPGVCFLTAGHVVISSLGHVPEGQVVYQPRPCVPSPDARDVIGHTKEGYVGNDGASGGYLDYAAVLVPEGHRGWANRSVTSCLDDLRPHLSVERIVRERTPVRKFGANTWCTEGVLSAWHRHLDDGTGRTFENVLEFASPAPGTQIAGHGDSGSLVVSRAPGSEGAIVGLLFAVSHDHTRGFVMPFERVARLGFRLAER